MQGWSLSPPGRGGDDRPSPEAASPVWGSLCSYSVPTALVVTGRGPRSPSVPAPTPAQPRKALGFPPHLPRTHPPPHLPCWEGKEHWAGPTSHSPCLLSVPGSNPSPSRQSCPLPACPLPSLSFLPLPTFRLMPCIASLSPFPWAPLRPASLSEPVLSERGIHTLPESQQSHRQGDCTGRRSPGH